MPSQNLPRANFFAWFGEIEEAEPMPSQFVRPSSEQLFRSTKDMKTSPQDKKITSLKTRQSDEFEDNVKTRRCSRLKSRYN